MFFGRSPKALFGVYHPPKAMQARPSAVVLCYPFGQEYMRAHRAFRQMAMLLAKTGFHVLRFDYSGTGDSTGDGEQSTLADWVSDAREAADELREQAEVSRVSFVGLRLGAAIAAMAADGRPDVDDVVLWDPAVHGPDYLAEILEARTDSAGHSRTSKSMDGTVGVSGFPLTPQLRTSIAELDLLRVGPPRGSSERMIIVSHERPEYAALASHGLEGVSVRQQLVPSNGNWNDVDDYGGVLIPVYLMQAIVSHLSRSKA